MTRMVACVPTIGMSPYLDDLVYNLDYMSIRVRLYVNSEHVPESVVRLVEGWPHVNDPDRWGLNPELVHVPEQTIYVSWNQASAYAREHNAYLLCVTDDVVLTKRLPGELAAALDVRPQYGLISTDVTCGPNDWAPYDVFPTSHQANTRYEFATWCFIADPTKWVDVDPRYKIWYGDDDLIWKMNAAGHGVGYLRGIGVTHHTSTTSRQLPWVMEAATEDGVLWAATH